MAGELDARLAAEAMLLKAIRETARAVTVDPTAALAGIHVALFTIEDELLAGDWRRMSQQAAWLLAWTRDQRGNDGHRLAVDDPAWVGRLDGGDARC